MTKFGDELGIVEIDFFGVISAAAKHGFTREEIDKAYKAALASAVDLPGRGRPKGSLEKGKNIEHYLTQMFHRLRFNPDTPLFPVAKEILGNAPAKWRPTPQHLTRVFKAQRDKDINTLWHSLVLLARSRPKIFLANFEKLSVLFPLLHPVRERKNKKS
jgi:hypothetical protein